MNRLKAGDIVKCIDEESPVFSPVKLDDLDKDTLCTALKMELKFRNK